MNSSNPISHDEARELLPWLVNGSLRESERERVREHAGSCVICRREVEELQQIDVSVRQATDGVPIPAPDMRRINARIDALVERQAGRERLLVACRDFVRRPWRMAFVAQSIALVALIALLLWPQADAPEYTTLTNPEALPAGEYIRVVFDPDLDADAVAAIADKYVLDLVSGPSVRGVATLRYADTDAAASTLATVEALLHESGVLFAQPLQAGEP